MDGAPAEQAAPATLTRREGGWLRIVRHEGAPYRTRSEAGKAAPVGTRTDRDLAAKLRALGSVDVIDTSDPVPVASAEVVASGEPAPVAPDWIAVRRVP